MSEDRPDIIEDEQPAETEAVGDEGVLADEPENTGGVLGEDDTVDEDYEDEGLEAAARVNRVLLWVVVAIGIVLVAALGFLLWRVAMPAVPRSAAEQDLYRTRDAVERAPDDPYARVEYANALYRTGDSDAAIRELETALSIQENLPEALYNLAVIRWYAGEQDKAVEEMRALVKLVPRDQEAWFRLGTFLEEREDWKGAAEAFGKSVELTPGDAPARVRYGRALERLGDKDAARAEYEKALEFVPDYKPALEALSALGE